MANKALAEIITEMIDADRVHLPVSPELPGQVKACLAERDAGSSRLWLLVGKDPALICRLFRAANSSFYAGLPKTLSIGDAVTRLGHDQAVRIVEETCFSCDHSTAGELVSRYLPGLWQHAQGCALGARWLARRCGYLTLAEQAYFGGLLHDIGKFVLLAALQTVAGKKALDTDFSEALLEFVTPAFSTTWEALRCICDIHQFTYSNLGDEMLWTASMPCRIPANREIPLARYGTSNVGRMKTIYRRGLGYRYGRQMQVIAGVHFNYSLPETFWPAYRSVLGGDDSARDFRSEHYLRMIRNFRRMGWIVLYLFGSSPAVCKSFAGPAARLPSLNDDTWFEPWATSLRMSDLGYSNKNQSRINISLNSVDEYVRDLSNAICTPEPSYEEIGVKVDGRYRQLNANLLQIENEYYSPVRPKRIARSGEQPTAALRRDGIEYVEGEMVDQSLLVIRHIDSKRVVLGASAHKVFSLPLADEWEPQAP